MSSPTPDQAPPSLNTSGHFLIRNKDNNRYVAGDATCSDGTPTKTVDGIDESNPDNYRFKMSPTDISGQYLIVNVATQLTLVEGLDDLGNVVLIWADPTYPNRTFPWNITNSSMGLWDFSNGGSYWKDSLNNSGHTVQLVAQALQGSNIQWQLIAA
jgi:hypothetical protein